MGMVVRTNIMAMNANRQLGMNNNQVSKSLEKLSSGFRINRAGDDAAGLAISEKMKAQIKGLEQASANSQDGISLVQTAEGALTEVHSMLNRMVELATKSANGTIQNEVDRDAIQSEVNALLEEIDRIGDSTNFNGINLLDGSLSSMATATKTVGTPAVAAQEATEGTITFTLTALGSDKVLTVGNYTYTEGTTGNGTLADLKTKLEAAGNITIDGNTYTAAMDADTGEVTLTATAAGATNVTAAELAAAITVGDGTNAIGTFEAADVTKDATTAGQGAAAIEAVYTIALTGGTTAELNGKAIDGQTITWNTDLDTTMGDFVTAYNGDDTKAYTASYAGGTLTLTAKEGGAVNTDPTHNVPTLPGGSAAPVVTEATEGKDAVKQKFTFSENELAIPAGQSLVVGDKSFATVAEMDGEEITIGAETYTVSVAGGDVTLTNKTGKVDGTTAANVAAAFTTGTAPTAVAGAKVVNGKAAQAAQAATGGTQTLDFGTKNITAGYKITVGEGDNAKTFEFVAAAADVTAGNEAVVIGADLDATLDAFETAIGAADLTGANVTITRDLADDTKFVVTNTDAANLDKSPAVTQQGAGLTLQVGDTGDAFNMVTVSVDDMRSAGLGVAGLDVSNADAARAAIDTIKTAINKVSTNRANMGALQNRLEYTINNLDVASENMTAANSRIRDTDMAKEMMEYTKTNVLTQAAQAMLAQANQQPQSILQLLQ